MKTLTPPDYVIKLRKTEATILMMCFDSGLININNYTLTSELVFGMKKVDDNHKKLMEELLKLQAYLYKELYGKDVNELAPGATSTTIPKIIT